MGLMAYFWEPDGLTHIGIRKACEDYLVAGILHCYRAETCSTNHKLACKGTCIKFRIQEFFAVTEPKRAPRDNSRPYKVTNQTFQKQEYLISDLIFWELTVSFRTLTLSEVTPTQIIQQLHIIRADFKIKLSIVFNVFFIDSFG